MHLLTNLYDTAFIQLDFSSPVFQVLADVVGHGERLQHKPALRPVLPLVTFLQHKALQRETGVIYIVIYW